MYSMTQQFHFYILETHVLEHRRHVVIYHDTVIYNAKNTSNMAMKNINCATTNHS